MSEEITWLEPQSPEEIVNEAITKYKLDKLYVLFSGGKDSVSVAHYISTNYPKLFAGVVFTNTGLGARDTRKFVIEYSKEMGWPLFMTWPKEGERYYQVVMRDGFAGRGNHKVVMGFLKHHNWREFMMWRIDSYGEKPAFISGVRKKESWARTKQRLYTKTPTDREGRLIFIKPFLYKNGIQLWEYYNKHDLKKSSVYSWYEKSGECYCGSFAEPWEMKLFEKYDPGAFEAIRWLEQEIKLHGSKKAQKYNKWGNGPTSKDVANQTSIEDYCGESCEVG